MAIEEYCEELDAALAANNEAGISLEEIHGFMSAVLCGPRPVSFKDCICAVFLPDEDDNEQEYELPARLMEMLSLLYEDTVRSIDDGSFLPVVECAQSDEDEEEINAGQWCCGFLMAIEYDRSGWKLDTRQVLDLLAPIILLADPEEFGQAAAHVQEISADDFRQELLHSLPGSVLSLKKLFKKKTRSAGKQSRPAARRNPARRPKRQKP